MLSSSPVPRSTAPNPCSTRPTASRTNSIQPPSSSPQLTQQTSPSTSTSFEDSPLPRSTRGPLHRTARQTPTSPNPILPLPASQQHTQAIPPSNSNTSQDGPVPRPTRGPIHRKPPNALRILQWNAGGLTNKAKRAELDKLLQDLEIDIAAIQETHFSKDFQVRFPLFTTYRKDRTTARHIDAPIRGGGVATLVRNGIQHQALTNSILAPTDSTTDATSVRIHNKTPISIHNIYVPPIRNADNDDRQQNFDPHHLPDSCESFICGDFNAHSRSWDPTSDEDRLGILLDDWITDADVLIANDGQHTRTNPATGNTSAPDLTIHSLSWFGQVEWTPLSNSMGSDHQPILITVRTKVKRAPKRPSTRLSYKKADWTKYKDSINSQLLAARPRRSCNGRLKQLTKIIKAAAKESIPTGSSRNRVPWWNEEVQDAVDKRQQARANIHLSEVHRNAWIEQCRETDRVINNAKSTSWRKYASSLSATSNIRGVWRTIKAIDGRGSSTPSGATLIKNGRPISSSKGKAAAFIQEYASVSNVKSSKEDRPFQKYTRNLVRRKCSCQDATCRPFQPTELKQALRKIKANSSPGPDGISNQMLLHLPEKGLDALLDLFNQALKESCCPADWRRATIIPILKKGKDPQLISSYRPISLTSCLGKLFERLLKERLYFWLETNHKLSNVQAGFRSLRSTEDHLIRIIQEVYDGFQRKKPPARSVMALVDFSRAFDKVWHTGLLYKLKRLGTPQCWVRWIDAFLSDRVSRVEFEGVRSAYRHIHSGVPQGSVISPLLFLIYIDDVVENMPANSHASLFADDLAIWSSHPDVDSATNTVQEALDNISTWSHRWKMQISASKSETILFTPDSHQANLKPNLLLDGVSLSFNPNPTFLGVTLDRSLSFKAHAKKLLAKLRKRNQITKALAGTSWGLSKEDLRIVASALSLSCVSYCAAAWMPSTCPSTLQSIQACVNEAARTITGCCRGSPQDLTLVEADLVPVHTTCKIATATSYEKACRLPVTNPLASTVTTQVQQRTKKLAWRTTGKASTEELKLHERPRLPLLPTQPVSPWNRHPASSNIAFHSQLMEPASKSDQPERLRLLATQTINLHRNHRYHIWTDGSATNGTLNGGSGVVIYDEGNLCASFSEAAGTFTSSYAAEMKAIDIALSWLCAQDSPTMSALVCTDSQSAVQALSSGPPRPASALDSRIWSALTRLSSAGHIITFQWVPGHVGLEGNERADLAAKQATLSDQSTVAIPFKAAKTLIKRSFTSSFISSIPPHRITGRPRPPPHRDKEENLSRRERVILAQLRAGAHCPILGSFLHRIGKLDSPKCLDCDEPEDSLQHALLECPRWNRLRNLTLGAFPSIDALWEEPAAVAAYLRGSGRLDARR